jgi:hypothetical protein
MTCYRILKKFEIAKMIIAAERTCFNIFSLELVREANQGNDKTCLTEKN